MTMRTLLVLTILAAASFTRGETRIGGDIHALTLDRSGSPYVVDQDIFIPAGKKLVIREGAVFLFKNFTGLNIQGQLDVEGTASKPVVFSSINDADHNPQSEQLPNSFDWNGIIITREAAGASFKNIQLKYSVYGIKAQNTAVTIQNGLFYQNGQFHFTINDKIQAVQDNAPFSYDAGNPGALSSTPAAASPAGKNKQAANAPVAQPKRKTSTSKLAVRYSCLGIGVIGVGVGVAYSLLLNGDMSTLEKIKSPQTMNNYTPEDWDNTQSKANADRAGCIIGYSLGVLGLAGFGITFAF